jgi:hypothetical protein
VRRGHLGLRLVCARPGQLEAQCAHLQAHGVAGVGYGGLLVEAAVDEVQRGALAGAGIAPDDERGIAGRVRIRALLAITLRFTAPGVVAAHLPVAEGVQHAEAIGGKGGGREHQCDSGEQRAEHAEGLGFDDGTGTMGATFAVRAMLSRRPRCRHGRVGTAIAA